MSDRYDKALGRARKLYNELKEMHLDNAAMDIQKIFPELAENEDERIRKWLVDYFTEIGENWIHREFTCKQIVAYLEKQKEQKLTEHGCADDESEYDKGYRDGHKFGLQQTENYTIGKTFKGLIPCWINAPSTLQSAHQYHGKNVVVMHENNGGFRCVCIDDEKPVTFHLPDDVLLVEGWRKREPAEWNEEDEKIRGNLMSLLANMRGDRITEETYQKYYPWLKSLRPSWKPSEEQMKALKYAAYHMLPGEEYRDVLFSLFKDLKKLM